MRIISDTHDYYDCMQRLDEDRETLYIRKPETVQLQPPGLDRVKWPLAEELRFSQLGSSDSIDRTAHLVGFCGKTYPVLVMEHPVRTGPLDRNRAVCHVMADVDAFMEAELDRKALDCWDDRRKRRLTRGDSFYYGGRRKDYVKFFEEAERKEAAFAGLFEEMRCPVFVASPGSPPTVTFNAVLKDFAFYRIFDAPRAYQEIQMFLWNMASPQKPIPKMDDVTMAESKGFDKKYSFRKDPSR